MNNLVIAALKERGIQGKDRTLAAFRHGGGKGDGVSLADADIVETFGKNLAKTPDPGAGRHGGGDGDYVGIRLRRFHEAVGENIGVGGSLKACRVVTMAFHLESA